MQVHSLMKFVLGSLWFMVAWKFYGNYGPSFMLAQSPHAMLSPKEILQISGDIILIQNSLWCDDMNWENVQGALLRG